MLAHSAATLTPTEVFRLRVEGESLRSHPFWSDLYLPKLSYRRCSCPRRCPMCNLQNPPDSEACRCGFEFEPSRLTGHIAPPVASQTCSSTQWAGMTCSSPR